MFSRTNDYIAAMHTFEYGRFKGTFLQNHFSEMALRPIIRRGTYFKTEGEEKLFKHMAIQSTFCDFYIAERILGAILSK